MQRALAVVTAAALLALFPATSTRQVAAAGPPPLPSTRLEFGLSNLDAGWMTASGVPWGYRFTYLAGGVNTSNPWPNWQDPSLPPGQFAVDFMNGSTTAPASYIPVFTYYELLQSNPSVGGSESERDFNNLNNTATMGAYYANFKLLMQKAGAYGKQVVVHVEPDFWGYMQQRAAGGGATAIAAKVKSSGFAEAGAFADNLAGFAAELKYLRDTYAPSVVLALHASLWASSIDIGSTTDPNVDPRAEADKTSAFLNSVGMWDAVFNDVDDHDAAWWELASCGSPPCVNQWYTHWWDPNNVKFPNFTRYLAWVDEMHVKTARPQVVWQVPMGNQYFLTLNNTCNHYQDNVAPYFISHASDLFNAGLVAVLFGPGNECQTSNEDSASHDGVTNNGGRPTSDALGGCNLCNFMTSTYPDDDGGYLRIFVGQYYTGCKTASVGTATSSPQQRGASITFIASSTGCASPRYEFWLQWPSGAWTMTQGFGTANSWTWDTSAYPPGNYNLHVWANQAGSWTASYQALGAAAFTLNQSPPCSSAAVTPPSVSAPAGSSIALSASSSGCPYPRYEYWIRFGTSWYPWRPFSGDPSWSLSTAGFSPGTYLVHAWANQAGDQTAALEAVGESVVTLTGCTSATLQPAQGTVAAGTSVTFTAASSGCPNPQYEFWIQDTQGYWHQMTGFGGPSWTWVNTGWGKGTYHIHVWANQQGAYTGRLETVGSSTYVLT